MGSAHALRETSWGDRYVAALVVDGRHFQFWKARAPESVPVPARVSKSVLVPSQRELPVILIDFHACAKRTEAPQSHAHYELSWVTPMSCHVDTADPYQQKSGAKHIT